MGVERYGTKTDVVVKLILVFFISLLSFSIGTFVGKKFSDNQHKISQLEPGAADHEGSEARSTASAAGEAKTDALSDEEIAKLAEEFVADEDVKPAARTISSEDAVHVELKKDTKPAAAAPVDKTDKVGAIAQKVSEGKPTHDTEHAVEKKNGPVTALPKEVVANANGKFTVQVASYPKEDEAQGMASDLKNKGFSAFYIPAMIKGQTWYRVSVGLFTTQKEAQSYRDDLLTRAKVSSAIVQKITQ